MTQPVDRVWVLDPNGNLGSIPAERLGEALSKGYRAPQSNEEVYQGKLRADVAAESETLTGQAQAFTESLASGATLGVSDAVLRDIKGKEYAQKAALRRETEAGQTGEIVGAVAPALLSGGASLPAGAAARVGAGAGRLVEQQLARGVGRSAVGRMGAKAAGYGTEGALTAGAQQIGSNIGEASLKDEELTAELLQSGLEESVLFGAGFGALLGAGVGAGREGLRKAGKVGRVKDSLSDISDTLTGSDAAERTVGTLESIVGAPGAVSEFMSPITGASQAAKAVTRASGKSGGEILRAASDAYADALGKSKADKAVLRNALGESSARQDYLLREELQEQASREVARAFDAVKRTDTTIDQALARAETRIASVAKNDADAIVLGKARANQLAERVQAALVDPDAAARALAKAERRAGIAEAAARGEAQFAAANPGARSPVTEALPRIREELANAQAAQAGGLRMSRAERAKLKEFSGRIEALRGATSSEELFAGLQKAQRELAELSQSTSGPAAEFALSQADELSQLLTSTDAWGAAAQNTKKLAAAAERVKLSRAQLEEVVAAGAESHVKALRPGAAHQQSLLEHIANQREALTALADSGVLDPRMVRKSEKALSKLEAARVSASELSERVAQANALDDIVTAERGGVFGQYQEALAIGAGLVAGPSAYLSTKIIGALARPGTLATQIAAIESVAQRAAQIKRTADGAVRSMVLGKPGGRFNVKARSSVPVNLFGDSPTDRRKGYRKRAKQLQQLQSDPEQLIFAMQRITDGLEQPAPSLTAQISAQHARSVAYLVEQLPQPPSYLRSVADRESWTPSSPEITAFERKYRAVSDPMSVIEDARKGNLTPEAVEALKATKPKLWEAMRLAAMDAVAEADHHVDYSVTVQLAILFDFAAAPTLEPEFLHTHQQMMAARSEEQAAAQEAKKQAMPPPKTLSTQSATLSERVAMNT